MDSRRELPEHHSIAVGVSRAAFCLYVVFMLVGSGMPFKDHDVDSLGGSNLINQIVDSIIPIVCFLCLWPRRKAIVSLLREEKYMAMLIAWCAISTLWSGFPFNSLKASIRLIGSTVVIFAFLANAKTSGDALKYIRGVLAIYIPVSLLAIAFIPAAIMPDSDAWRGLTTQKNVLGEVGLISALTWAAAIPGSPLGRKMLEGLFLAASLLLVWGSQSATSLMILAAIAFLRLCLWVNRRLGRIALAPTIACCLAGVVVLFSVDATGAVFDWLGRDTTFTGRTAIWNALGDEIRGHPIIGCGFNGFWLPNNRSVEKLYASDEELSWRPTEGHEGYLDLMNEVGVVGVLLFVLVVIRYFKNVRKSLQVPGWTWFVVGVLLLSLTESVLLRTSSFTSWFFILAYFATYSDRPRQIAMPREEPAHERHQQVRVTAA
jgi:O-antigen ligase